MRASIQALSIIYQIGLIYPKTMPPSDGRYFYADFTTGNTYGMHSLPTIAGESQKNLTLWLTFNQDEVALFSE